MSKDERQSGEDEQFTVTLNDIEEYEYEEFSFNGKPVKSRLGLFFLKYVLTLLIVFLIVGLLPFWGPVHLARRAFGAKGVFWRDGDELCFKFLGVNIFWRTRETVEIVNHDKNTLN